MAYLCDGTHAFIHDCVKYKHPQFDVVTYIITKYFTMVSRITMLMCSSIAYLFHDTQNFT